MMDEAMTSIPCFVLCSPVSPGQRSSQVTSQLDEAAIPFSFVTGYGPGDEEIGKRYSRWHNLILAKRSLSPGEVAVHLGHQKIWRTALEQGADAALVFEDDFRFADIQSARQTIDMASRLVGSWDVIKLYDFKQRREIASFVLNGIRFALHERPNSGLVGYIISANGCKRLLSQRRVFRPVDDELRHWFAYRIRVCSVVPDVVFDNSDQTGGSLLEQGRANERARRNLARSVWGNFLALYIRMRSRIWVRKVMAQMRSEGLL